MDSYTLSQIVLKELERHYSNQARCTAGTADEIARSMLEKGLGELEFIAALSAFRKADAKWEFCPQWRKLLPYMPKKHTGDAPRTVMGLTLDADHFSNLSEAYSAADWSRISELMEAFARYYPNDADLCWKHHVAALQKAEVVAQAKAYWAARFGKGPRLKCSVPVAVAPHNDDIDPETGMEIPF